MIILYNNMWQLQVENESDKPYVMKVQNMVMKVFDNTEGYTGFPNCPIILIWCTKLGGVITPLNIYQITPLNIYQMINGSLHCFTPSLRDRANRRASLTSFHGALEDLERVHSYGFFHGDVRLKNIIFTPTGNSHLIDFDLSRPVSSEPMYPIGYISSHPERHRNAKALHCL